MELNNILKIEDNLNKHIYDREFGYELIKGRKPILLSAPHSVEQTRDGKIKYSETRTACIVDAVARTTKSFGIFKTYNFGDDANYDEVNYFKDIVKNIVINENIKFLLDIHIMSASRGYNFDIGTGDGVNIFGDFTLSNKLKSYLDIFDLVKIDYVFKSKYKNTMSSYVARVCSIPCIQLEINYNLTNDNNMLLQLIDCVSSFINEECDCFEKRMANL